MVSRYGRCGLMAAPRMAPLTPNSVMASGPMQQMLDATLVSAADEAPTNALRLNPELEDMTDSPIIQWLPVAKTGPSKSAFR